MINQYSAYCRYKPTGEVVRIIRQGYNGWYILINNKEEFVQDYNLESL